ncbi:Glycosylphosphatidylinositol (GPI) anchor assembly protein [Saxophila tyrrhenica]|uniref:Glycosylphosphatidylinositol (GPI) anchor assembly protein n=1 Tax=Saxophila tyrrhenica TaxID=1690608 RepID=A0AAV9PBI2_9PEZI|nr:Glycosylphosphatidylinositol (GPI) anchor assembly protein [Saxophila tyrrhenica]
MSTPTSNGKAPLSTPPSKPVDILQTQPSLLYSNLHPILLLSILLFSFKTLVRDPVNTLLGLAPTVTILQALYCVLCLPSTNQAPAPPQKPGQKKKQAKPAQDAWAKAVPAFLSLLLTLFLSTPILYITLILFGAPLTTHQPHTILLALHFALLTTPQLYYAHGLEAQAWYKIVSLQLPVDELVGMSLGACMGAWVGAIPIPLDWDREWQKWPVTIVAGMYGGAVVGKFVGGYVCRGWRIKLS